MPDEATPIPAAPAPATVPARRLRRLGRDRATLTALAVFAAILLASFAGLPLASWLLGHTGQDPFPYAVDANLRPVSPWTRVPDVQQATATDDYGTPAEPPAEAGTTLLILGADGPLGRDEFLRLLEGGKTSIEIALGGALIALLIGVPLGLSAGYFGGLLDATITRLSEFVMAFPLILFLVMVSVRLSDQLNPIGWSPLLPPGVFAVALVIGLFTWFYPARLVRARVLVLRSSKMVEAARMIGASDGRIIRRHLLPHVLPTVIVWAAVAAGTNILLEVGISFLGVGVQASTPTWGSMLATTWGTIFSPRPYDPASNTPWLTLIPTLAILVTVVCLNRIGDAMRVALDPRAES